MPVVSFFFAVSCVVVCAEGRAKRDKKLVGAGTAGVGRKRRASGVSFVKVLFSILQLCAETEGPTILTSQHTQRS
jgi:hypothetical protein